MPSNLQDLPLNKAIMLTNMIRFMSAPHTPSSPPSTVGQCTLDALALLQE